MDAAVARLERVADRLERLEVSMARGGVAGGAPAAGAAAPAGAKIGAASAVQDYDTYLSTYVSAVTKAAAALDKEVQASSAYLVQALTAVRTVLDVASRARKPDQAGLQKLLGPVIDPMSKAGAAAEGRRTAAFNHVKAVAEAIGALSWLAYSGPSCGMSAPGQHIAESWSAAEFFVNKVLMENRNNAAGGAHVEWAKSVKEAVKRHEEYVRRYCQAGLAWAAAGVSIEEAMASAGKPGGGAPPPPRAGGPPPPAAPPPPPPGSMLPKPEELGGGRAGGGGGPGGMEALFKDIAGKGDGVTAGLRKVTDDMKSKNRADRSGVVPAGNTAAAAAPAAAAAAKPGKPAGAPKLELQQGRKWVVENHVGNREIVIKDTDPKQSVYIYGCADCVVQVQGKVNNVVLDSCSKTGVVMQDVIAACDVVNCTSVQVQAAGKVPTVSIDKTDGCQLFLSQATAAAEGFQIVTAKSSEMNVVVLGGPEEVEHALPEQFISTFSRQGKLVTAAAAHAGA